MTVTAAHLLDCEAPEDLFGDLPADRAAAQERIRALHRELARVVHPDRAGDSAAFGRLTELTDAARRALDSGMYGQRVTPRVPITIASRNQSYVVDRLVAKGTVANLYGARKHLVKVARSPADNHRLHKEAQTIEALLAHEHVGTPVTPFLPALVETFEFDQGKVRRRATAFDRIDALIALTTVQAKRPDGVDPRDTAWIFRRLLTALGLVHATGITHGAIEPAHVLIHPAQHGVVLVDWKAAGNAGRPQLDLAAAAATARAITGVMPRALSTFFDHCDHRSLPADAFELLDEFDDLIERLWGKRTFRPFDI